MDSQVEQIDRAAAAGWLSKPPQSFGDAELSLIQAFAAHRLASLALPKAESGTWQPIETAPKDGTRILVQLRSPLPVKGRSDLDPWQGIPFVARHHGVADDGFDIGWSFAAPVGQGGFPDAWFAGWRPLPSPPSTLNTGGTHE